MQPSFDNLTFLLGDAAQLFQALMVAREVQRPGAADQQQAAEGAGIEGTLAPVDAEYLALVPQTAGRPARAGL